jgi:hypothetical protein
MKGLFWLEQSWNENIQVDEEEQALIALHGLRICRHSGTKV